jgi:hypothetical protein
MTDSQVREAGPRQASDREARTRMVDRLAASLAQELRLVRTPLAAEVWASGVAAGWQQRPRLADLDPAVVLGESLVAAFEHQAEPGGVAALRALAAVCEAPLAGACTDAADRLVAGGLDDPDWASQLGRARPVEARLAREDIFDDGVSVLVEFEQVDRTRHVLGVYVDHNLSSIAKDIFVGGSLAEVAAIFSHDGDEQHRLEPVRLAEAAALVRGALELTDITLGAPVSGDFWSLRALAGARLSALPPVQGDVGWCDVPGPERAALRAAFLEASEGERFRGWEDAELVVSLLIDFCADYVDGRPLRWSPVVVELFMTDWLGRNVAREPAFFAIVPDVVRQWVRYSGRRRGVPEDAVVETAAAVDEWTNQLLEPVASGRR